MNHIEHIDQMGNKIVLPYSPKRIISLVPSQTELLFDLGLEEEIVGLTKFCVHPAEKVKSKARIGGTKTYHLDKIKALQPDLIIGNKEENDRVQVEQLMQHYPVWMSDVKDLDTALEMIDKLGSVLNREKQSQKLISEIRDAFSSLPTDYQPLKTAYFIWRKPYMVAGNGTFIHEMMKWAGFENLFSSKNRYPEVNLNEVQKLKPEVILLPSEPFPFSMKYIGEFEKLFPNAAIKLVDGELFSWYGSRLKKAPSYFMELRKSVES